RTIEAKDPYTGGHTERVATIAQALATRLGFNENELRAVEVGSIVHDIGKIGIPDGILLKHGPLSEEELREMRRHTDIASYILAELELPQAVKQMARSHHERYDGEGYPDGLVGEEIPLAARILSVADALDAMTSDRPYRKALPLDVASAEIQDKVGTQFCPRVVVALRSAQTLTPGVPGASSPSTTAATKASPTLSRLAASHPGRQVEVIVQLRAGTGAATGRALVRSAGGTVTQQVPLIHGLGAD